MPEPLLMLAPTQENGAYCHTQEEHSEEVETKLMIGCPGSR